MKDNQLQVILSEQDIPKDDSKRLLEAFGAPFEEAGVILADYKTIAVTSEKQVDLMAQAREKRLTLKKIRTGVEGKRKELKENSLKTGRAIDSVAKFVEQIIKPAEDYLEQQEKFAELRAAERAATKKAERIGRLSPLVGDVSMYNFEAMTDQQFEDLITEREAARKAIEDAKAKQAAEKLEREKAAAAEQERIRIENAKLKKEAEEREKAAAAERAKNEKAAAEAKAKAEAEAAKIRAERLAEQKAAQAKLDEERKKREAIETEQRVAREKAEAEQKRVEEEKRQSLLAPDKEKLLALATQLEKTELPALSSKDAQAVLNKVEELLAKVSTYIRGNVKGL